MIASDGSVMFLSIIYKSYWTIHYFKKKEYFIRFTFSRYNWHNVILLLFWLKIDQFWDFITLKPVKFWFTADWPPPAKADIFTMPFNCQVCVVQGPFHIFTTICMSGKRNTNVNNGSRGFVWQVWCRIKPFPHGRDCRSVLYLYPPSMVLPCHVPQYLNLHFRIIW